MNRMAEADTGPESGRHDEAFASSQADRDATLLALHRLEEAAGRAVPGRVEEWLEQVRKDLQALEEAISSEKAESLEPDSLLSMIGRDYPRRFGARVRQLRAQVDDVIRQVSSLREQLSDLDAGRADSSDVRERLGWLVRAIHHRRARETDLVYEAINLDLGRAK